MSQKVAWFQGDGTTTTFSLSSTPIGLVQVYFDGLFEAGGYTLNQNLITFIPAPLTTDYIAVIFWDSPQPPIPIDIGGTSGGLVNVAEVVDSPEFNQQFILNRTEGGWVNGKWNPTAKLNATLQYNGVIEVGTPKDIDMTADADILKGAITVWSTLPIFTTHDGTNPGSSDLIQWHGKFYRVLQVAQWRDYGYWRAVATRLDAS